MQIVIVLSVFYLVSQPLTFMKGIDKGLIEKYTEEMKKNNYNPNNNYVQIAVLDYAETKYQELTAKLEQGDFEDTNKQDVQNNVANEEHENQEVQENVENQDGQEVDSQDGTVNNETQVEIDNQAGIVNGEGQDETGKQDGVENGEGQEEPDKQDGAESGEQQEDTDNKEEVSSREELEAKREEYNQLRLNMNFLGLDLSKVPTQSLNDWRVYVIPALYVLTSVISIRITTQAQNKKREKELIVQEGKEGEQEVDPMDQMQQMNKSMMYMMPIMSVMIASIAPLGLALYWLMSNLLMIIERLVINKIMEVKEENGDKEENING